GSLICRLLQRGLVGSQALFIYPRDKPGVQEYDRWLSTVLEEALEQSDDKLSSMINLLFEQKSNIRTRMIEDATFRYAFRNDLWPKFIRVTTKIKYPFELYLNDPYLWDFVALSEGESLLAQWHWFLSIEHIKNLTPAVLLFGDDAYPKPLHPFIIKAILDNDANTLLSLLYYGKEPLFIRLMQRDLSDDLRQKVLSILSEQGVNYPVTLLNWDKASNTDLYAELLQDATGTLRTMKKVVQGREISNTEVFFAVLDVVSLTVSAVSLGSGSIMTSGVKQTMKIGGNVLKTMKYGAKARTYLFNDTKTLKQYVQNKLQISVNDAVANNASNMLLASFAKKEIYSQMIRPKGAELLSFNITPTMKFLFEQVNVNRTTLKRINHQWSSQLLIQKNGAVLIEMDHNKLSTELCLFFNETSVKNKILQAWQKNASAWWLMNATQ
ncbi:MAG: hypothetical protein KAH77_00695, partial [Thiomargarita sp.]|nr:hypothetical protein [Thiomargarita sp.]